MQCRNVLTRIDALRTGELGSHEGHEIQEHLGRCLSCNESNDDLERFAEAIRSLPITSTGQTLATVRTRVFDMVEGLEVDGERVWVAFSPRGVRMIDARSRTAESFARSYRERFGRDLRPGTLAPRERMAVIAAVRGEPANKCAVDLSGLTEFERDVLESLATIPRGEVRPYAWLAQKARRPAAVRAVGNVMARNPVPFILPCHRVVPSEGGVGNYAYGRSRKRALLEAEGVPTAEINALARRRIRYVGSKTTHVFCYPTCRDARRIREENRVLLHDLHDARDSGFRPCSRCTPAAKEA